MTHVVVWFTEKGQHCLRFKSLADAKAFSNILIADEHDEVYIAEIVEEIVK